MLPHTLLERDKSSIAKATRTFLCNNDDDVETLSFPFLKD